MKKYWQIFKISFQQEFAYKFNFVMWRVRNILQIFVAFFLWSTIFSDPARVVFGYDRAKILTYVFGIIVVRALVLSARAADVSADVSQGWLSNYLVKPMSYFKYWFTRDISSKALNILFAVGEFALLYLVFRPSFFFQSNLVSLAAFALSIAAAIMIYFYLLFIVSAIPFWAPELGWGSQFLVIVIMIEFLSGALFPINILPPSLQSVILSLPFPYLIYFPIQVYLGNVSGLALVRGLLIAFSWVGILLFLMKFVWKKGLTVYESIGR